MTDLALILPACEQVGPVAVIVRQAYRNVGGKVIVAAGQIGVTPDISIRSHVQLRLGRRYGARVAGNDLDDAARRVAPEQRPLRPVQDLDALNAAEVQQSANRRGEVDAVDVGGDAIFDAQRGSLADPSKEGLR